MAGPPGLEPGNSVLETDMIPFHHGPIDQIISGKSYPVGECLLQLLAFFVFGGLVTFRTMFLNSI